mmetsp:Transcript_103667/g.291633  ORF Transcript_103667/g.291633 Transcript_103667/m.291633 type:complete len:139 (+) Transcript_103667:276-692(+)
MLCRKMTSGRQQMFYLDRVETFGMTVVVDMLARIPINTALDLEVLPILVLSRTCEALEKGIAQGNAFLSVALALAKTCPRFPPQEIGCRPLKFGLIFWLHTQAHHEAMIDQQPFQICGVLASVLSSATCSASCARPSW